LLALLKKQIDKKRGKQTGAAGATGSLALRRALPLRG
jgi:hypothetical protein